MAHEKAHAGAKSEKQALRHMLVWR